MITSLLSLYITSVISPDLGTNNLSNIDAPTSIIQTLGTNFSNILETKSLPVKDPYHIAPLIYAEASITVDINSGATLYEKSAHKRLAIASITKLMTVMIILEENELDEVATVSNNAASIGGSTMYLVAGEKITLENLIKGAMINSANDAAVTLAEHNAGTVDKFVKKMNAKADQLDLINTSFSNPIGLDDPNNYSSAHDIATLARYVYQKQVIRTLAQTKETTVTSTNGNFTHKLESTNELLDSYLRIKGLKTGRTDSAGLCLVAIAENDSNNEIVTVVLDSPARFTESKILIDWIFRAYKW